MLQVVKEVLQVVKEVLQVVKEVLQVVKGAVLCTQVVKGAVSHTVSPNLVLLKNLMNVSVLIGNQLEVA